MFVTHYLSGNSLKYAHSWLAITAEFKEKVRLLSVSDVSAYETDLSLG